MEKKKASNKNKDSKELIKNKENDSKSKSEKLKKNDSEISVGVKSFKEKDKKTTFNFLEVIIIMIITALFGAFIGSSVVYFKTGSIANVKIEDRDLEEFVSTYNNLLRDYYGKLDKNALLDAGIKGMIEYLDDPYSAFMDKSVSDNFNEEIDGNYVGMGAEIRQEEDNTISIVTIFDNSPAQKAGVVVGDIIVKVGEKDVRGMNAEEVSKLIKGKAGTKVKISVMRNGENLELELTRNSVDIPSVSSDVLNKDGKNVGYIRIDVFAKNTAVQFEKNLSKLKREKIEGIIIDVRGNSGGYLSVVTEIASKFLDKDDVVYQLETRGIVKKVYASNGEKCNLPVVVLIDGASASASEILASSLNENNNSPLVGIKTYGKGTVQQAYQLNSGATIKYTIQSWLTAKGNKIDKVGIKPTKKVSIDESYYKNPIKDNDNQLQAAVSELLK